MIRRKTEHHLVQPQEMEIVLYLDPTLYWFSGHFAVQPPLLGVTQSDWVMHYAVTLLVPGWCFRNTRNVKSLAPLISEMAVTPQLIWQGASQIFIFCYQCHDGDAYHAASSGEIRPCQ